MQSPEKRAVNLPQKFKVTISETLMLSVEIEAVSQNEAVKIASDGWRDSKYTLDADDFVDVSFDAVNVMGGEGSPVF